MSKVASHCFRSYRETGKYHFYENMDRAFPGVLILFCTAYAAEWIVTDILVKVKNAGVAELENTFEPKIVRAMYKPAFIVLFIMMYSGVASG